LGFQLLDCFSRSTAFIVDYTWEVKCSQLCDNYRPITSVQYHGYMYLSEGLCSTRRGPLCTEFLLNYEHFTHVWSQFLTYVVRQHWNSTCPLYIRIWIHHCVT